LLISDFEYQAKATTKHESSPDVNTFKVALRPLSYKPETCTQEQLCRKLASSYARFPSGKWMVIEVEESPS